MRAFFPAVLALALLACGIVPGTDVTHPSPLPPVVGQNPPSEGPDEVDLSAYDDLGTWIDIYDPWAFDKPKRTARRAAQRGVTTLYVETSNYTRGYAIYRPEDQAKLIRAAHARNIDVVAWYLPGLLKPAKDFERSMAAINFHRDGQRFDAFGLDIEASAVDNENVRSERLIKLSARLNHNVDDDYPLGAIIPSPRGMQLVEGYWEHFPYEELVPHYEVWLPMGYYTYRVKGRQETYDYTRLNTEILRDETGNPDLPIHSIGGIANHSSGLETKGFRQAVVDDGILGGSLYDMGTMQPTDWKQLQPIAE